MLSQLKKILLGVVRDEIERSRPERLAEAAEIANATLEAKLADLKVPRTILETIEKRSQLATQQAVACSLETASAVEASTNKLLEHLPGFINAMASVPALAKLIQNQRLELDTLKENNTAYAEKLVREEVQKFASETHARLSKAEEQAASVSDSLQASVKAAVQEVSGSLAPIEARLVDAEASLKTSLDREGELKKEMAALLTRVAAAEEQAVGLAEGVQTRLQTALQEVSQNLSAMETRLVNGENLVQSKLDLNRDAIENEMFEQRRLWEAISKANLETQNLWKSAELATREIGNLWQRTEFIRSEILYEMKYSLTEGPSSRTTSDTSAHEDPVAPRVRNAKLIENAPAEGFKVNLGCGHVIRAGYVNVDLRELPGVDVVADVGDLPFSKKSVAEFYSAHVLEHFPEERLKRLLPYWRGLLKPGGRFQAVVPDGEAMLAAMADGSSTFSQFREVLFGGQEYDGDFHYNLFTPSSLTELLKAARFKNVKVMEKARRNGICFEFEIGAEA